MKICEKTKQVNCEECEDTGWISDQGPGRQGNEYVPCECKDQGPEDIKTEITELERSIDRRKARLEKFHTR